VSSEIAGLRPAPAQLRCWSVGGGGGFRDVARVESGLRVVLDHQLAGLCGLAVDLELNQAQTHVVARFDAARRACRGDDALGQVLNRSCARKCVVAVSPFRRPAAASTSPPVHTEVV